MSEQIKIENLGALKGKVWTWKVFCQPTCALPIVALVHVRPEPHCLHDNLLAYRRVLTRIAFSQSELHSLHVLTAFSYTYPATELSHRISYPTTTLLRNDHTAYSCPPTALQLPQLSSLLSLIIHRLTVHPVSIRNSVTLLNYP